LFAPVEGNTNERQNKTNHEQDKEQKMAFLNFAYDHLSFTRLIALLLLLNSFHFPKLKTTEKDFTPLQPMFLRLGYAYPSRNVLYIV